MVWGTKIAAYLFLAGLSAGAFITSTYVCRKYPDAKTVRFIGRLISPILMAIGLLLLIIDAEAGFKHPLRFMNLYTNFHSVMTIGTYIITVFMLLSLYVAILELMKKDVSKIVEYTGDVFAIATAIYTGFLIGVVGSVPFWNTSVLPVLFVVSAMSTGIAGTLLVSSFMNKQEVFQLISVKKIHLTLLIIELILVFTLLLITSNANEAASESVAMLLTGKYSTLFWFGLIVVGLLIPTVIEIMELMNGKKANTLKGESTSTNFLGSLISETFVVIGGFILRFLVLAAAVPVSFIL